MQQALYGGVGESSSTRSLSLWAELPGLCCQAAGGHPEWADDLTVAWLLFYAAADLMDKVQDQDQPAPWWRELGPGAALGAATGLFFSACLALNRLHFDERTRPAAAEVAQDFYNGFMEMTGGQYADLTHLDPSLEQYWSYIDAKSGAFFGLACRSAARLATQESERLQHFSRYGHHLGILVQIQDDLEDIRPASVDTVPGQRHELARSLAVIYARSVLPAAERQQLELSLAAAPHDESAARELIRLLNDNNVTLYLASEMERHRNMALEALQNTADASPARETLEAYINNLVFGKE